MQILRRILNTYEMENVSVVADDVVNQRGSYQTLKNISLMIVTSRLLGTLLAQLLFIPEAKHTAWA